MDSKRHENKRRKEKENSSKDSESKGEKRRVLRHEWSQTRSEVSATLDVGFPVDSNQVTLKCTDGECSITLPGEGPAGFPMPDVYSCVVLKETRRKPAFSSKRRDWGRTKSVEKGLKVSFHVLGSSENLDMCREKGKADTVGQRLLGREALWVEFTDTCGHQIYLFCSNMNAKKPSSCADHLRTTFSASSSSNGRLIVRTCRHRLSPCKLELILKKVVPAKWSCLELPVKKEPMAAPSNTWMPVSRSASLAAPPPEVSTQVSTPISLAAAPEKAGCSEPPTLDSSAGDASSLRSSTLKQEEAKVRGPFVRSPAVLEPEVALGFTGLDNLGNTCFMNSVLQCLANTREFRDYFLGGVFQGEINTENPLGMRGELAVAFAVLLRWLWSGAQRSYAPSRLKSLISVKAPQFTGFAQHDAQEFMAFLLDGLHEDLNRIHNKPYVESVDSANRPDEVVAEESWSRYKLRNDSIVVDLFQGQYKSTVICPECQKVSINFDPFLYLSVPLPKKQKIFVVHFYHWDPDQVPIKLRLRLNQDARVEDLKDEIFKKTHVSPRNLRLLEVYNRKIYKVFNRDDDSLMDITPKDLIFAFEILDRDVAREKVVEVAVVQRLLMPHAATTCASCGVAKLEALKRCTRCLRVGYCNRTCQTNHWHQHKSVCKFVPELIGLPFVLSLPQSQATYANLCRLMEAYSRQDSFSQSLFFSFSGKDTLCMIRMAKFKVSAQRAANGDHVNACSNGSSLQSAVVTEEEAVAANVCDVPSASTAAVSSEIAGSSACLAPTASGSALSSAHLMTGFLTHEEIEVAAKHCKTVQAELGAMPATQRKLQAMQPDPTPATATSEGAKVCLVQVDILSNLLSCTVCKHCLGTGLTVQEGTELGLATKLEVICPLCGIVSSSWSSPRQQGTMAFEINIRSKMAIADWKGADSSQQFSSCHECLAQRSAPSSKCFFPLQSKKINKNKKCTSSKCKKKKPQKLGTLVMSFLFSGNEPLDLSRVYYLAMDWRNDQRQGSYVLVESKEVVGSFSKQPAFHSYATSKEDGISLDQCLRLFTEPEVLSPQEAWYCPGCKEHRQATKELSLWRLPPVLIIQLKRFSFTRSIFRDKIDKMVDFPISGLDVGPYYCGPACESGGPQPVYDLFAVINHHGGMLGGHYTAFGRCTDATDTRLSEVGWRLFDDSRVNAVSDARVATSAAYMLFYRRRNAPFELSLCGVSAWRPRAVIAPSQKLLKDRENLLDQEFSAQNDANNNRCHYGVATPDDASVDMDSPD
ncbi:unnamed protein product [Ixodes persulcatus]